MKELLDMFFTFARIGGLTFGGGHASDASEGSRGETGLGDGR